MIVATRGSGTPLVLIPGLHGRWEYMREAVDALAASCRVFTFALCGERASGLPLDASRGLDDFVGQVLRVLDDHHVDRAVVCGVSFGGVVAVRFAAVHPERTEALVLTSTPPPTFQLKRRHEVYARYPRLFGPVFLAETPGRLRPELAASFPRVGPRARFAWQQVRTFLRAPVSLARMGERGRILAAADVADDCRRVSAPTLVVTGERGLDHVVPVEGSSQYLRLIAGAQGVVLAHTGHHGVMTRPDEFARVVRDFVDRDVRTRRDRAAS